MPLPPQRAALRSLAWRRCRGARAPACCDAAAFPVAGTCRVDRARARGRRWGRRESRAARRRLAARRPGRGDHLPAGRNSMAPDGPGLEARYALALFAAGREVEACAVDLGDRPGAEARLMSRVIVPRPGPMRRERWRRQRRRRRPRAPPPRSSTRKPRGRCRATMSLSSSLDLTVRPRSSPTSPPRPRRSFCSASPVTRGAAPELRLAAAERAASLNVIAGDELARAYREAAAKLPEGAKSGPALRARLFASFDNAPSANIRAESIGALLASARDQGIEVPVAQALAQASGGTGARTRKPISSPRPASGSPRSPATRRALGPGSTPAGSACAAGSSCSRRAIRKARGRKPRSRPASTSR